MAVAQKVAGFTLGQADVLRRAMGKKKKSELDKQFADFEAGMQGNGYSKQAVQVLWDTLMPFADYAFNKAHAAGYGVLSYWTAYLKANHPAEYMAALLTSVGDSKDKLGMYLSECRRMGIQVLPPDVNESSGDFTAVPIADGVASATSASASAPSATSATASSSRSAAAREEKGRFTSFHDFLRKVPIQAANKRTVESLIKAGAFDSLGSTRRALLEIHEDAVEGAVQIKRNEANGQVGFDFDSLWDEPRGRGRPRARPPGVGQARQARVRARDARPLRLRPSARRARAATRQARDDHDPRADRRRDGRATARPSPSPAS